MVSVTDILDQAKARDLSGLAGWLETYPSRAQLNGTILNEQGKSWALLHWLADAEARGVKVPVPLIQQILDKGANPHQGDERQGVAGATPFNIAAGASPAIGRLMANHWLAQAVQGKGEKKLNDPSGSHGSSLAQYLAKWSNGNEIEGQLDLAQEAGMKIAVQNASGWTPLMAAGADGNAATFKAFISRYSDTERNYRSRGDAFTSTYGVSYGPGLDAGGIIEARLQQEQKNGSLSLAMRHNLQQCREIWSSYQSIRR